MLERGLVARLKQIDSQSESMADDALETTKFEAEQAFERQKEKIEEDAEKLISKAESKLESVLKSWKPSVSV